MIKLINFIVSVFVVGLSAVTLQHVFNWIPAEIFNLKTITFGQAIALGFFIELIQFKKKDIEKANDNKKTEEEELTLNITYLILLSIFLVFAFIFSLFI